MKFLSEQFTVLLSAAMIQVQLILILSQQINQHHAYYNLQDRESISLQINKTNETIEDYTTSLLIKSKHNFQELHVKCNNERQQQWVDFILIQNGTILFNEVRASSLHAFEKNQANEPLILRQVGNAVPSQTSTSVTDECEFAIKKSENLIFACKSNERITNTFSLSIIHTQNADDLKSKNYILEKAPAGEVNKIAFANDYFLLYNSNRILQFMITDSYLFEMERQGEVALIKNQTLKVSIQHILFLTSEYDQTIMDEYFIAILTNEQVNICAYFPDQQNVSNCQMLNLSDFITDSKKKMNEMYYDLSSKQLVVFARDEIFVCIIMQLNFSSNNLNFYGFGHVRTFSGGLQPLQIKEVSIHFDYLIIFYISKGISEQKLIVYNVQNCDSFASKQNQNQFINKQTCMLTVTHDMLVGNEHDLTSSLINNGNLIIISNSTQTSKQQNSIAISFIGLNQPFSNVSVSIQHTNDNSISNEKIVQSMHFFQQQLQQQQCKNEELFLQEPELNYIHLLGSQNESNVLFQQQFQQPCHIAPNLGQWHSLERFLFCQGKLILGPTFDICQAELLQSFPYPNSNTDSAIQLIYQNKVELITGQELFFEQLEAEDISFQNTPSFVYKNKIVFVKNYVQTVPQFNDKKNEIILRELVECDLSLLFYEELRLKANSSTIDKPDFTHCEHFTTGSNVYNTNTDNQTVFIHKIYPMSKYAFNFNYINFDADNITDIVLLYQTQNISTQFDHIAVGLFDYDRKIITYTSLPNLIQSPNSSNARIFYMTMIINNDIMHKQRTELIIIDRFKESLLCYFASTDTYQILARNMSRQSSSFEILPLNNHFFSSNEIQCDVSVAILFIDDKQILTALILNRNGCDLEFVIGQTVQVKQLMIPEDPTSTENLKPNYQIRIVAIDKFIVFGSLDQQIAIFKFLYNAEEKNILFKEYKKLSNLMRLHYSFQSQTQSMMLGHFVYLPILIDQQNSSNYLVFNFEEETQDKIFMGMLPSPSRQQHTQMQIKQIITNKNTNTDIVIVEVEPRNIDHHELQYAMYRVRADIVIKIALELKSNDIQIENNIFNNYPIQMQFKLCNVQQQESQIVVNASINFDTEQSLQQQNQLQYFTESEIITVNLSREALQKAINNYNGLILISHPFKIPNHLNVPTQIYLQSQKYITLVFQKEQRINLTILPQENQQIQTHLMLEFNGVEQSLSYDEQNCEHLRIIMLEQSVLIQFPFSYNAGVVKMKGGNIEYNNMTRQIQSSQLLFVLFKNSTINAFRIQQLQQQTNFDFVFVASVINSTDAYMPLGNFDVLVTANKIINFFLLYVQCAQQNGTTLKIMSIDSTSLQLNQLSFNSADNNIVSLQMNSTVSSLRAIQRAVSDQSDILLIVQTKSMKLHFYNINFSDKVINVTKIGTVDLIQQQQQEEEQEETYFKQYQQQNQNKICGSQINGDEEINFIVMSSLQTLILFDPCSQKSKNLAETYTQQIKVGQLFYNNLSHIDQISWYQQTIELPAQNVKVKLQIKNIEQQTNVMHFDLWSKTANDQMHFHCEVQLMTMVQQINSEIKFNLYFNSSKFLANYANTTSNTLYNNTLLISDQLIFLLELQDQIYFAVNQIKIWINLDEPPSYAQQYQILLILCLIILSIAIFILFGFYLRLKQLKRRQEKTGVVKLQEEYENTELQNIKQA